MVCSISESVSSGNVRVWKAEQSDEEGAGAETEDYVSRMLAISLSLSLSLSLSSYLCI